MKHEAGPIMATEPLLECVGNTPLIELELAHEISRDVRVFAKLECMNPGGSLKDRPVARMLLQARMDGHFDDGRGLLDACYGNAGISYAMLGAAMGIPVTLVMPGDTRRESLNRIGAYGAEIIITDAALGEAHARQEARRLADEAPERYWLCDQYHNPASWQAHYYGTAAEILSQLSNLADTMPDAFVVGVDTGGTLTGAGRRLREARPDLHIAAVIPATFPGIEGLKPLGSQDKMAPPLLDKSMIHEHIPVTLHDAWHTCRQLARHGLFVGPCSGAYAHAALNLAACEKFHTIVTILPDSGFSLPVRKQPARAEKMIAAHA